MMSSGIDYGNLMHHAMRGLIRDVLRRVAKDGLPGDHHFFITLNTANADLKMAKWLRDRYPDEITIVIQHWFENLQVDDSGFSITLNFGNQPEPLYIPFDAVLTFVDPSVEFGLKFEVHVDELDEDEDFDADDADNADGGDDPDGDDPDDTPTGKGTVVSLDKFRK